MLSDVPSASQCLRSSSSGDWNDNAIDWGMSAHRWYETNRYLEPLRGAPRFEALMAKAKEKARAFEV